MTFLQIFSNYLSIEKGKLIKEEKNLINKVIINENNLNTSFYFQDECVLWYPRMTIINKVKPFLKNINSLCYEGTYSFQLKQWKRFYLTLDGITIHLVEDIPESGGQNCLWAAGLVMARYLESSNAVQLISNKRVLELGAGAGLTSMVASLLGGEVHSTEQKSCLDYLKRNISLNPDIIVYTHELFWTSTCSEQDQFDVIIGCDITYDVNNFEAIFHTIKICLSQSGILLLCHDEESCPLSKRAQEKLIEISSNMGLVMTSIDYQNDVPEGFYQPNVKMWKFKYE